MGQEITQPEEVKRPLDKRKEFKRNKKEVLDKQRILVVNEKDQRDEENTPLQPKETKKLKQPYRPDATVPKRTVGEKNQQEKERNEKNKRQQEKQRGKQQFIRPTRIESGDQNSQKKKMRSQKQQISEKKIEKQEQSKIKLESSSRSKGKLKKKNQILLLQKSSAKTSSSEEYSGEDDEDNVEREPPMEVIYEEGGENIVKIEATESTKKRKVHLLTERERRIQKYKFAFRRLNVSAPPQPTRVVPIIYSTKMRKIDIRDSKAYNKQVMKICNVQEIDDQSDYV